MLLLYNDILILKKNCFTIMTIDAAYVGSSARKHGMTILLIGSVLLGAVLGRFFKVLVLVPACAFVFVAILVRSAYVEHGLLPPPLEFAVLITSLQIGYVLGLFDEARSECVDEIFLMLLRRLTARNRPVGVSPGKAYAPALFEAKPDKPWDHVERLRGGDALERLARRQEPSRSRIPASRAAWRECSPLPSVSPCRMVGSGNGQRQDTEC
jgi:hypothetical protein